MKTFNDLTKEDFAKWMQASLDDNYYTDDGPELFKKQFHYVFVYGTLKKGFSRFNTLANANAEPVGPAMTVGDNYIMYRTDNKYPYPVILHTNVPSTAGRIQGEVWKVPTKLLFELDFIESNTEMYHRTEIPVEVLIGRDRKPVKMIAWAYIGCNAFWRELKNADRRPKLLNCDLLSKNKEPEVMYYTFMKKYTAKAA